MLYCRKDILRRIISLIALAALPLVLAGCSLLPAKNNPTVSADPAPVAIRNSKTVVLDAGHGGSDPGCVHGGVSESDINLVIALLTKDALEELGYKVILTREDDSRITIERRVDIANEQPDYVLVSIHQNALENDTEVFGVETYYNSDKGALHETLAQCVQDAVCEATGAGDRGIKADTQLKLIREAAATSCLVETGFLSSTAERESLVTEEYQQLLAQGIADGVDEFYSKLKA